MFIISYGPTKAQQRERIDAATFQESDRSLAGVS